MGGGRAEMTSSGAGVGGLLPREGAKLMGGFCSRTDGGKRTGTGLCGAFAPGAGVWGLSHVGVRRPRAGSWALGGVPPRRR